VADVAFDGEAVTTASYSGSTSFSVNHTTAGSNRCAVLCLGFVIPDPSDASTVTYGGAGMSEWVRVWQDLGAEIQYAYIFTKVAPATGSTACAVTFPDGAYGYSGVMSFNNVSQTRPIRATAGSQSQTQQASISTTVPTNTGEMVVDCVKGWQVGGSTGMTAGADQTERYDGSDGTYGEIGCGSTQAGSNGGVMSWTPTPAADMANYCHAVASLCPVGSVYAADFTASITVTERWNTTYGSVSLVNGGIAGGYDGLGAARLTMTNTTRYAASWDDVDGDSARDNVELLTLVQMVGVAASDACAGLVARGSGTADSENGYRAYLQGSGFGVNKYVSGASTSLDFYSTPLKDKTWYFLRFRVYGTSIRAKLWELGVTEPDDWQISVTDSSVTGTGWVGLAGYSTACAAEYACLGVGTGGEKAPGSLFRYPVARDSLQVPDGTPLTNWNPNCWGTQVGISALGWEGWEVRPYNGGSSYMQYGGTSSAYGNSQYSRVRCFYGDAGSGGGVFCRQSDVSTTSAFYAFTIGNGFCEIGKQTSGGATYTTLLDLTSVQPASGTRLLLEVEELTSTTGGPAILSAFWDGKLRGRVLDETSLPTGGFGFGGYQVVDLWTVFYAEWEGGNLTEGVPLNSVRTVGTPVPVDWATGQNPAAQNIVIPADCTSVYMFWTYYNSTASSGLSSATLNSVAPDETFEVATVSGKTATGVCVWHNVSTGTQSLDVAWDQAPAEGPTTVVAFVKGAAGAARDIQGSSASSTNSANASIATQPGDLVFKYEQRWDIDGNNTPIADLGWLAMMSGRNVEESSLLSLRVANDADETGYSNNESESTMLMMSVKELLLITAMRRAYGPDGQRVNTGLRR